MNRLIGRCGLILMLIALAPSVFADDERVLYEFKDDPTDFRWYALNDTVMGGRSQSNMALVDDDVVVFFGDVSLENDGGFASIRSAVFRFDIDEFDGIRLRVRGDGKTYKLRLQTDGRSSVSYERSFETVEGEWTNIPLRFDEFRLVYFGRTVPNAPELDPADIRTIGFMISDKQSGEFRIEIDRITAFKTTFAMSTGVR